MISSTGYLKCLIFIITPCFHILKCLSSALKTQLCSKGWLPRGYILSNLNPVLIKIGPTPSPRAVWTWSCAVSEPQWLRTDTGRDLLTKKIRISHIPFQTVVTWHFPALVSGWRSTWNISNTNKSKRGTSDCMRNNKHLMISPACNLHCLIKFPCAFYCHVLQFMEVLKTAGTHFCKTSLLLTRNGFSRSGPSFLTSLKQNLIFYLAGAYCKYLWCLIHFGCTLSC